MDMRKLGLFRLMSDKMTWHNQRQEVLAQNVANADTPGYRPNDLVEFDFKKQLRKAGGMPVAGSAPGHLAGTIPSDTGFRDGTQRRVYETAPAGNAVVLEEQMMKVGQNAMDYQSILNIYRKQVSMLRTALGRGGGQ